MAKPTIVCVPGAWHVPEIYADTTDILNKHGHPTINLPLPSVGAMPPNTDFTEDVKAIRTCVTELVEQEKEIVLVTHSYIGMPGTEAPVGLGKKEREGKRPQGRRHKDGIHHGICNARGFHTDRWRGEVPGVDEGGLIGQNYPVIIPHPSYPSA